MSELVLTTASTVSCDHQGTLAPQGLQDVLLCDGAPVLVQGDLTGAGISSCTITPSSSSKTCTTAAGATGGWSAVLKVDGVGVLLESAAGQVDGYPPTPSGFSTTAAGHSILKSD
jgi:hypothetical protein